MDWGTITSEILAHSGIAGFLLFGVVAAGSLATAQAGILWRLASSLKAFSKAGEIIIANQQIILARLSDQHEAHTVLARQQEKLIDMQARVIEETAAVSRAAHDADVARSRELTQLLTTLLTSLGSRKD